MEQNKLEIGSWYPLGFDLDLAEKWKGFSDNVSGKMPPDAASSDTHK